MSKKERILIVDDSANTLEVIKRNLTYEGYEVFTAYDVRGALKGLEVIPVELVITDLHMPKVSGMDLIKYVKENIEDTEIIMITGYASIENAVEAVKNGAEEYLAKPFREKDLLSAVRRALDKLKIRRARNKLQHPAYNTYGIIGQSAPMKKIFGDIEKVASIPSTVLISGESGTGKELVARAIHYTGSRSSAPFVPVNCGAIPENLLESELFGHVKGAFTGAIETKAGFFQTADGGTILFDEVSETSLSMQIKLLRVLQDKEICMVGSQTHKKIDVRVIAATNKDLHSLVTKGTFREDLFFRLNVITIDLPPLRERGDDIVLLIYHFAEKFSRELGKPVPKFSDKAIQILKSYHWPGNVRELQNVINRLVVLTEGDMIEVSDLPSLMRFSALKVTDFSRPLEDVELEYISNVLSAVGGNKSHAAEILRIDRKTLRDKLKKIEDNEIL
ncbi:MAG: sigma-54 dependent transcriptional regulator [Candidatus Eremiobacterota bacterium]